MLIRDSLTSLVDDPCVSAIHKINHFNIALDFNDTYILSKPHSVTTLGSLSISLTHEHIDRGEYTEDIVLVIDAKPVIDVVIAGEYIYSINIRGRALRAHLFALKHSMFLRSHFC